MASGHTGTARPLNHPSREDAGMRWSAERAEWAGRQSVEARLSRVGRNNVPSYGASDVPPLPETACNGLILPGTAEFIGMGPGERDDGKAHARVPSEEPALAAFIAIAILPAMSYWPNRRWPVMRPILKFWSSVAWSRASAAALGLMADVLGIGGGRWARSLRGFQDGWW